MDRLMTSNATAVVPAAHGCTFGGNAAAFGEAISLSIALVRKGYLCVLLLCASSARCRR